MEDEDDDFDDRSLVQWKRQKVLLEKRLVKSLISRGKSPRARESTLSSAERGLDDTSVHYTRAELTPSQSPQTPSTSTSVVNDAGISSTYADEQMVVSELPLERPPLRPSPKKGGCQVVRRRKSVRGVRDGRQTSLHQFATVVQRETSNGSLKNSQQPPSPLPVANSTSSRDELVTIVDQTATRSVFSKPLQTSDRGRKVVVTGGSVVEVKGSARKRQCPFYKRVPETGMTVDAFSYGSIPECPAYFLSHFHSDHYMGLSSRFQHPIYCTQVTANLVEHVLKVPQSLLHPLLLDEPCIVEGTEVTLIDANHCPGSVMFLFKTTSGNNYLHTGDFRFCLDIVRHPSLSSVDIHHLFLDTTYCKPQYSFPTQQEVIDFAVKKSREALSRNSDTVVVSGTYTIGKERVFLALAEALGSKICVTKQKERILRCLLWPRLESLLTTDPLSATVHVLPMKKLNIEDLSTYLDSLRPVFSHLVAFVPTGWSHSNKCASLSTLQPKTVGPISIYSIPYSEHSSFPELRQFVEGLHPNRMIPTVGNKSTRDRNAMMHHLQQWRNGLSAEIHTRQTSIIDEIFSMQHH